MTNFSTMFTRILLALTFVATIQVATSQPAQPDYPLTLTPLTSPANPDALGPALTRGADGQVYLSWLESSADGITSFRYAQYDAVHANWSAARLIAQGRDIVVSDANAPQLAVEKNGQLTAVWFVNNPDEMAPAPTGGHHHSNPNFKAWSAQSADQGATWSDRQPLATGSNFTEFVALQPLGKGGVLSVWLDGRAKHADGKAQQFYGRVIGQDTPEQLIDDSVCDCCNPTLTAFPNGDVIVAYRARREGEIRDIYTARFSRGEWTSPRILNADGWQIDGCPVNGPRINASGGLVSAAWFTGADDTSRVYATISPDAGARFLMPQRVDLGNPRGRVDLVQLRDGSRLITWLESKGEKEGGLYLRRISKRDEIGPAVLLASTQQSRVSGWPRIALVKDYDATPAQLLVTYLREPNPTQVDTVLVTLPDLSTLAQRKPCLPCDEEEANADRGYPIKGVVTKVMTDRKLILVKHEEIPGVMRAMTMAFKVEPQVFPSLIEGQELLGRIERRGRDWHLFNVKLLGSPATKTQP